jgi:Ca2+-binding EF-hand superfamily protein
MLLDAGDPTKYISIVQFDGLLKLLDTPQTDYTPMHRISGFYELQGNVKKIKVSTVMERVYQRKAMRAEVEEQTLRHIATYIEKREGFTIDKLFNMFDEGDKDGQLTEAELITGLQAIKINVNQQLKRILLAIFDHNKDGTISKEEFFSKVSKYSTKAPITTDDI